MPGYVCRYRRDDPPRYFLWSRVVDSPTSGLMSRDEMRKKLYFEDGHNVDGTNQSPDARMDRADENGSSSMWSDDMYWDSRIFTQEGTGERESLQMDGDRFWYDPPLTPHE